MGKRFLIISLAAALFLVVSGGVAMAEVIPLIEGDVEIEGTATDSNSQESTLLISQPDVNALYVTEVTGRDWPDTIPLLVEGGNVDDPLSSILVIRSWGDMESELRFDSGAWSSDVTGADEFKFINAAIYTKGNDQTLRLKAGAIGLGKESELRVLYNNGNVTSQIVGDTDSNVSLGFLHAEGRNDDDYTEYTVGSITRYANSNDLNIVMPDYEADGITPTDTYSDVMTFHHVVEDKHYVGIGTTTPETLIALNAGAGGKDAGITQNYLGGAHTLELTTGDLDGDPTTRILLRGGSNDKAHIEFYRGPKGAEQLSMKINGTTGAVRILSLANQGTGTVCVDNDGTLSVCP